MAQILKEEFRFAILSAAKKEFYDFGYEHASMRRIAKQANMTVGNVYRYFKNKEMLAQEILSETLEKINLVIDQIAPKEEGAQTHEPMYRLNYFHRRIEWISTQLVEIFKEHKEEFVVIIYQPRYSNQMIDWFKKSFLQMVSDWFPKVDAFTHPIELLCHMLAESIVAGLSRGFKESVDNPEVDLAWSLQMYLHLYTTMLYAGENLYEKT
ncbi:MAG TPA: hypothetical protein DEA51_05325 [Erysipelotrichaceae bacterium]|nr:hypothetical protein [Erysipelotrichaceae bacterium]